MSDKMIYEKVGSYDKEEALLSNNFVYNRNVIDRHYKDIFFLLLFAANILIIVSIALSYGVVALDHDGAETVLVKANGNIYHDTTHDYDALKIIFGVLIILSSAGLLSTCWIYFLSKFASYIISAVLICIILVTLLCAVGLIVTGFLTSGITLLVSGILILVGSVFLRPRIDFAAANLRVACQSISHMPSTIVYALMVLVLQIVFVIIWTVAASGYATNNYSVTQSFNGVMYNLDECTTYRYTASFDAIGQTFTCTNGGTCQTCICNNTFVSSKACFTSKIYIPTFFALLLSLFWTCAVFANIVHCTTASSVSAWWITAEDVTYADRGASLTRDSFVRSCTTSLGSICFGSLLVAIVRTFRTFCYLLSKRLKSLNAGHNSSITKAQLYLLAVFEFLLRVLDSAIAYFNRYAFCFVAIYGSDFITASRAAVTLFRTKGLSTLLNDDLIDLILNLGNVLVGVLCMCVGYYYSRLVRLDRPYTTLLSLLGLFGGFLLSMVVMSTISSAVATVYVCFAEHPEQLENSHPEEYALLSGIWSKIFAPNKTVTVPKRSNSLPSGGSSGGFGVSVPSNNKEEETSPSSAVTQEEGFVSNSSISQSGTSSSFLSNTNSSSHNTVRGSFKPPLPSASHHAHVSAGSTGINTVTDTINTASPVFGRNPVKIVSTRTSTPSETRSGANNNAFPERDVFQVPKDLYQAATSFFGTGGGSAMNDNSTMFHSVVVSSGMGFGRNNNNVQHGDKDEEQQIIEDSLTL